MKNNNNMFLDDDLWLAIYLQIEKKYFVFKSIRGYSKKYKGLNSIKAHKYLASLHFSAMIATNFFKNKNRKIHKYAAYTAVGSFAAAIMVFKF